MRYANEHGIKAICFDIDGTLYPKWKMYIRLAKASVFHLPYALKYSKLRNLIRSKDGYQRLPAMSYEEISKMGAVFFYGSDSPAFQKKYRDKEKQIFHDFYLRAYSNIKSAEGVEYALKKARSEGFRMAVLSDFPIGVKLTAMEIDSFFEFAISSEDLGHFKPSLTPFVELCSRLGLKPDEILYVGDSYKKDILGAKNAGMHTCLVFSKPRKEYTKADLCVPSWKVFADKVL